MNRKHRMESPKDHRRIEEQEIEANIAGIAEAVNTMNLDRYGKLITADFVNMNKDMEGVVTSTVGRSERLDVLRDFFESNPYRTNATMTPREIVVDGSRAFARIDGILKLSPKEGVDLQGFTLTLDLYLFYVRDEEMGWLSERSIGLEKTRTENAT
jgi:hypothetical protein